MKVQKKLQTIITLRGLLIVLLLPLAVQSARAANFFVTNTADSGAGSLREAINLANANPGTDIIRFLILPAGGIHTINLQSELPVITDTVTIDGWIQGRSPFVHPGIELRGNSRLLEVGLQFGSFPAGAGNGGADSLVRGLIINGFSNAGIKISTQRVTVIGCRIGTNANGDAAQPNGNGVWLFHATDCQIGGTNGRDRNVISGNTGNGILAEHGADNLIQGNYIGLSASGLPGPLFNNVGVWISDLSGDLVGGQEAGARNVISGNLAGGIVVTQTFDNTRIEGNYIGTLPDGITAFGNGIASLGGSGIALDSDYSTVIGGPTPEAGNVICGNGGPGIDANRSTSAVIENNLIGVGSDRTTPVGNQGDGIRSFGSSTMKIGGTVKLPKVSRPVPVGNIIAFNGGTGVELRALADLAIGGGNLISRNEIHDNAGLGIDINGDGVTANDECDIDSGVNGLQNFPTISTANSVNGITTITGHMNSSANTPFRIEFFTNPSCDQSGNGEGAVFLGSILISTPPAACDAAFTATFNVTLPPNTVITATATHPNGSTSEFSPCAFVGLPQ